MMRDFARVFLLVNVASTLMMAGVIWFVQIVHYPLFAQVGREQFRSYESAHQGLTTWVVAPLMLAELATAVALTVSRPALVTRGESWAGLGLVVMVWASTFLLQVPLHEKLARGFDELLAHRLVITNWVRTIAWSARAILCVTWMWRMLR